MAGIHAEALSWYPGDTVLSSSGTRRLDDSWGADFRRKGRVWHT